MTRTILGEHGESCATVQSIPLDLADAKADNSQFAVLVSASSASEAYTSVLGAHCRRRCWPVRTLDVARAARSLFKSFMIR